MVSRNLIIFFKVALVFSSLILSSCSIFDNSGPDAEPCNTRLNTFTATGNETLQSPKLTGFNSAIELETYIKQNYRLGTVKGCSTYTNGLFYPSTAESSVSNDATAGSSSASSASTATTTSGTSEASVTNIQEFGVDESDGVKSDGNYLYLSTSQVSGITYPVATTATSSAVSTTDTSLNQPGLATHKVRIMQLNTAPITAVEVATISYGNDAYQAPEMYLTKSAGLPDLLVLVGSNGDWNNSKTEVRIYNVSTPSTPVLLHTILVDGYLLASRRVNDDLYLISQGLPPLSDYIVYPTSNQEVASNQSILNSTNLSSFIPKIQIDNNAPQDITTYNNTVKTTLGDAEDNRHIGALSIVQLNLRAPQNSNNLLILNPQNISNLYVSPQSVYLASYQYPSSPWFMESSIAMTRLEATDIHKIALTNNGPVYRGSRTVTGGVGWFGSSKDKFRFSEFNGDLRLMTSTFDRKHRLFILGEDISTATTNELIIKSTLPNATRTEAIGKPGESIYSVRFHDTQAYVVTYRTIDPLYVLNLSNHADPFIAGQLTLPGYSDYLHPLANNLLLGVGKGSASSDIYAWTGNWWNNNDNLVKLSLFDVSNPALPIELSSQFIGSVGWSDTALAYDHRALAFLAGDTISGKPDRISIPISLSDTPNSNWGGYYEWTHDGFYMFEIDSVSGSAATISPAGKIVTAQRSATIPYSRTYGAYLRSVITTDGIHTTYNAKVWSALWLDPTTAVGNQ